MQLFVHRKTPGLDLMHWVTTQLNITEKEYFGLLWEDKTGEKVCIHFKLISISHIQCIGYDLDTKWVDIS